MVKILEETIILLNYGIKAKGIKLDLDSYSSEINISLNEDNLKQIFLNIILNSIDAISLNPINIAGEINISIKEGKDYVVIEIVDTGIGMSKEELTKIFDPFYTSKEDGTGIGLPIIHNIVNSSGGQIFVDSKINKGTKVTLLLPIVHLEKE